MVTKQDFLESFAKIILMLALICPVTSYFLADTCAMPCLALPSDKQSAFHALPSTCLCLNGFAVSNALPSPVTCYWQGLPCLCLNGFVVGNALPSPVTCYRLAMPWLFRA